MKESQFALLSTIRGPIRDLGLIKGQDAFKFILDEKITGFDTDNQSSGYQFSINYPQDVYIYLNQLSFDLDLYLTFSSWDDVKSINPDTGKIELHYANKKIPYIANSTNFGDQDESIFARLAPGDYWVKVTKNSPIQETVDSKHPRLIIDTKKFVKKTMIPNDKYLSKQWHLFNTGITAFFKNSIDYAQGYENNKDLFAPDEVNGIIPNTDIYAPEAWKIQHNAKNVVVAVVDQGVDIDHPDLRNNIWINDREIPNDDKDNDQNNFEDDVNGWNFYNDSNNPRPVTPEHAHGTHVAGIIAAEGDNKIGLSGVAWKAQIMPINVGLKDPDGLGNVAAGILYAVNNGAQIVNLSLGSSLKLSPAWLMRYMTSSGELTDDAPSEIKQNFNDFLRAFAQAREKNVLLVIAAGNDGKYSTKVNQWEQINNLDHSISMQNFIALFFDNAITVSATDAMRNLSPYSNIGHISDIGAPGGNYSAVDEFSILSTLPKGIKDSSYRGKFVDQGTYGYMQGTSMAAPVVSGSAALIKATKPKLSASEIRQVLLSSARYEPRFKGEIGDHGLILKLDNALLKAKEWKGLKSFFEIRNGSPKYDQIHATPKRSLIRGFAGNDTLIGNSNDDKIIGGTGDDEILPGDGKDWIAGGKGVDTIMYLDVNESPIYKPDIVMAQKNDIFDLSNLDANPFKKGIQRLEWIGTEEFKGRNFSDRKSKSGQLQSRSNGFFIDVDRDKLADFGVLYDKVLPSGLSVDNFIL